MKRTYLLLIITAILLSVSELSAQTPKPPATDEVGKKRITAEDVLTIRELYDVKLAPNGKQIAFVVNEPNDPKAPREPRASNVWIVPSDGREAARPNSSASFRAFATAAEVEISIAVQDLFAPTASVAMKLCS